MTQAIIDTIPIIGPGDSLSRSSQGYSSAGEEKRVKPKHFDPTRLLVAPLLFALVSMTGCLSAKHSWFHRSESNTVTIPADGSIPSELSQVTLPPYVIAPPDVLLIEVFLPPQATKEANGPVQLYPQPISGQHLVRIDGSVGLGIWGSLQVAGLTTNQAADAVRRYIFDQIRNDPIIAKIAAPITKPEQLLVVVDVVSYNSKTYFVITDGAGYGEQVYEFPIQGSETVLSALAKVGGVPSVGSKRHIWVARRTPHPNQPEQILPVDYIGTTQHGVTVTNYQILPGDRVYVKSEKIFRIDSFLQKVLTPVERILGVTLLGSSTVNSISGRNQGGGGGGGIP
jgi:polysaccharide biosynthesis/export protein